MKITRRELVKAAGGAGLALAAGTVRWPQHTLAAPVSDQPRYGGVLVLDSPSDPIPMNPLTALGTPSYLSSAIIHDALFKPDKDYKPVPNLAERFEVSPDGKVYTFHLKKGVKWHDGQPFTADDVKFTFETLLDPKTNTTLRGVFATISAIQVVDASTVRFVQSRPSVTLVSNLSYLAGIVPKHLLQGKDVNTYNAYNAQNPVGTGPFKLKEFRRGEYALLERNEQYHGDRPYLGGIVIRVIPDPNALVAEMKAGKVDISRVDSLQVKGLEGDSNVQVDYFNIPNYVFVAPNNNLKIFQDTKVRQALAYGLDRKAIMDIMVQGRGVLAAGPISPAYADFYNPNVKPYPFDPEKARALLREAGWTDSDGDGVLEKDLGDGRRTPLRFKQTHFQGRVDWEGFAAVVQDNWKKIGVQVLSDAVEFGQLQTARVIPRAYEVILNSWVTRPDPDMFNYFHSSTAMAGANYGVWRNKEADDLIESGQAERDPRKRKAIYWKLQEVCNREQPVIFTHHYQDIMATSKRTRGYLPASFLVNRFWSHKWWVTQ